MRTVALLMAAFWFIFSVVDLLLLTNRMPWLRIEWAESSGTGTVRIGIWVAIVMQLMTATLLVIGFA